MSEHDTIATRLSMILIKLNNGEQPTMQELMEEFNVGLRTIQRDINERLSYLPIEKQNGRIVLDASYLGQLTHNDIRNFARLSGIKGLFPSMDGTFLRRLFDQTIKGAYLVKGHHYENLDGKNELFIQVEQAILSHTKISFWYKSTQRIIEPYRLVNQKGIWYLAGVEDKLKSFAVAKMFDVSIIGETFIPDPSVVEIIEQSDSQWIGTETREAVFQIDAEAAPYFRRRALIPDQKIEKELEDGGIIASGRFTDDTHALNIVGYWLPHIKVLSPAQLNKQFHQQIQKYLQTDSLQT